MRNLTIRSKLIFLAALGVTFTVLVGVAGLLGQIRQSDATEQVGLNVTLLRNHMDADMMHDGIRGDVLAALHLAALPNRSANDMAALQKEFAEHAAQFRRDIDENEKILVDPAMLKESAVLKPLMETYLQKADSVIKSAAAGTSSETQFQDFMTSFGVLEKEMAALSDLIEARSSQVEKQAKDASGTSRMILTIAMLIALATLAATSGLLIRSIIRPLQRMQNYMRELSEGHGDLTRRLPDSGSDEIGCITKLFNTFIGQLHDMVLRMKQAAETVTGTAGDLSAQSGDIRRRAGQLSDRVMQISAATEEMSVSVSEVANSVGVTSTAAERTRNVAGAGKAGVVNGVQLTQRMVGQVQVSATGIRDLNELVQRIGSMANTIKEIADQTNLLALNAAIEAARAGEQGRGFAVVADEVRKLAERTSTTTADISATISQIQSATAGTVDAMHQVEQNVADAADFMRNEEQALNQIVSAADEVSRMAAHIASAAQEQSAAVEESARGMEQVSTLSEENTAAVAGFDQATQALNAAAGELQQLVAQFRVDAR